MNEKYKKELEDKTCEVLVQFYRQNVDEMIKVLHRDVLLIGAAKGQHLTGSEDVTKMIRRSNLMKCYMFDKEFKGLLQRDDMGIVAGTFCVRTVVESGEIVQARQRVTFVWKMQDGEWKILHMHISNPIEVKREAEELPYRSDMETYQYIQDIMKTKMGNKISFRDVQQKEHYMREDNVLYVEADGANCIVHCMDEEVVVKSRISDWEKKLSGRFLRIHRSYIVNMQHVSSMKRYQISICDGTILPVPEKEYKKIHENVRKWQDNKGL